MSKESTNEPIVIVVVPFFFRTHGSESLPEVRTDTEIFADFEGRGSASADSRKAGVILRP